MDKVAAINVLFQSYAWKSILCLSFQRCCLRDGVHHRTFSAVRPSCLLCSVIFLLYRFFGFIDFPKAELDFCRGKSARALTLMRIPLAKPVMPRRSLLFHRQKHGRMARNGNERNKPISSWHKCLSTFLRNTIFNTSFDRVREKDYRSGQGLIVGLICSTSIQLDWWRHFNRISSKTPFSGKSPERASVVVAAAALLLSWLCWFCVCHAHMPCIVLVGTASH